MTRQSQVHLEALALSDSGACGPWVPGPTYFRLTSAKISPQPGFPVTPDGSAHHSCIFVSSLFLFNVHSSLLSLPFHSNISYIETAEPAAVTLLGICSENPRPYQRDVCSPMFAAALVTVAKHWNQPSCLPRVLINMVHIWIIYVFTHTYMNTTQL